MAVALVAFLAGRCSAEAPAPSVQASASSRFADLAGDGATPSAPASTSAAEVEAVAEAEPASTATSGEDSGGGQTASEALDVPAATGGTSDGYTDVDGHEVSSPVFTPSAPPGASARCRDGSYSFSHHRRGTCSHHGGVADWL
ncbi:DUF3761 domain-containing protein [Phenylobacterium sp.]|uniref:DUF3761 domain-containing protein n=1 Tax=Phenylobacterium sp. TaxID=1871053 RepID=UPI0025E4FA24|nr:DUF3761 domain-containing protein [Phenylobacterium sp.]